MGGKNAAVVFSDADLKEAIPTLTRAAFINSGQVCLCASRIYVHRDIYETFVELLVKEARCVWWVVVTRVDGKQSSRVR